MVVWCPQCEVPTVTRLQAPVLEVHLATRSALCTLRRRQVCWTPSTWTMFRTRAAFLPSSIVTQSVSEVRCLHDSIIGVAYE